MNKNIRQDFCGQVKKTLDRVDKAGDIGNHFRGIVLIGDKNKSKAYSWIHAPIEDMQKLILSAMHNSDTFTIATAKAFEQYDKELQSKNKDKDEKD